MLSFRGNQLLSFGVAPLLAYPDKPSPNKGDNSPSHPPRPYRQPMNSQIPPTPIYLSDTRRLINVGLMLGRRLRRRHSIKPALIRRHVHANGRGGLLLVAMETHSPRFPYRNRISFHCCAVPFFQFSFTSNFPVSKLVVDDKFVWFSIYWLSRL